MVLKVELWLCIKDGISLFVFVVDSHGNHSEFEMIDVC